MADLKIIDVLGARARIIRCSGTEVATHDVAHSPEAQTHSTMLLPESRGDYFTVGESTEKHRRGRALSWPMEAQSPPGGLPTNGNGRVYAEAVLRAFACQELADRTFVWRPDGATESVVSAEMLLGESLKGELSRDAEVGLVVPDGLEENQRQAVIDACAPHGRVWLIPRTMAAAIAWCRSPSAKPYLAGEADENNPIGHIILMEAGFGPWAVTAVPIFRVAKGKKNWLVPKREASHRKVVDALTGWGLLARQANGQHGHPAMTLMNDPDWVLDVLDGGQTLVDECVNQPMPDEDVLPQMPGLAGGKIWYDGARRLASEVNALMSGMNSPCLGGEMVGALARVKKQGGYLRDQLLAAFRLKQLDVSDEDVSAGAALAMVGKANGTPTWFENLETIHLFFKDKNKLGDPIPGWEPLLPGKQMDAGRDYHSEQPIDKFSIPAGRNTITLTLQHTHEAGFDYRRSTTAQSQVCKDVTPILITVHAKPGQGFAVVTVKSKAPGLFAGKLDWRKMEVCKKPEIKHSYTPTAKLVPVEVMWNGVPELIEVTTYRLRTGRIDDDLVKTLRRINTCLNRCTHSGAAVPEKWKVTGAEKGAHIYYAPVSIEGRAPSADFQDALGQLHELLEEQVIGVIPSGGPVAKKAMKKAHNAGSRLMAWNYHGCPDCVKDTAIEKLMADDKLTVLDLHVLGLTISGREEIQAFMERLARDLPKIEKANNWLRAFRNLVRLNEHALRDVDDATVYDIIKDVLRRLEVAIDKQSSSIAANCLEAMLYVLKRRRYSSGFMAKDSDEALELLRLVNGDDEVDMTDPGYSEKTLSFLSVNNRNFVGILIKFLYEDATDTDIEKSANVGNSEEEDEEEE
jgi:hypothetical protein